MAFFAFVAAVLFDGQLRTCSRPTPRSRAREARRLGTFAGFVAFSLYCSAHENLFKTIAKIGELHWGRQIGLDLYLGLLLSLSSSTLNEGSLLIVLLWLLPMLVFANLATLLYFAVHFDQLVGHFL